MIKYIRRTFTLILIFILMGIVIGGFYYVHLSVKREIEKELNSTTLFFNSNIKLVINSDIPLEDLVKLRKDKGDLYGNVFIYGKKLFYVKHYTDTLLYVYPIYRLFNRIHDIFPNITIKVVYEDSLVWYLGRLRGCDKLRICDDRRLNLSNGVRIYFVYVESKFTKLLKMFHPLIVFVLFGLIIMYLNSRLTKIKQIRRGYRIVELLQSISVGFGVKSSNGEILYGNEIFVASSDLTKDETVINDRIYGIYKEKVDNDTMYLLVDKTKEYENKRFDEAVEEIAIYSLYSMEEEKVKGRIMDVIGTLLGCDRVSIYCKEDDMFIKEMGWYKDEKEKRKQKKYP